jgi:Na+/phosphate symporter
MSADERMRILHCCAQRSQLVMSTHPDVNPLRHRRARDQPDVFVEQNSFRNSTRRERKAQAARLGDCSAEAARENEFLGLVRLISRIVHCILALAEL